MSTEKMVRLYELAGAEVDRQRGMVHLSASAPRKAVELVIRVQPVEMTAEYGRETQIGFRVLLDPEMSVDNLSVVEHPFDEDLTIPVSQLRFLADEPSQRPLGPVEKLTDEERKTMCFCIPDDGVHTNLCATAAAAAVAVLNTRLAGGSDG